MNYCSMTDFLYVFQMKLFFNSMSKMLNLHFNFKDSQHKKCIIHSTVNIIVLLPFIVDLKHWAIPIFVIKLDLLLN